MFVPPVRLGLEAFAPLRRKGAANIPEGPALVVSNHVSLLDPCFTIAAAAEPIHWLATAAAMQDPVIGRVLQTWGSVPKKKFTVDVRAIRTLKKWLDLGAKVGSYPEGERSWDGELMPLSPGIESLVRLLKVPVLPVRILNADRVMPRWAERRRYGPVTIEFGQPRSFPRKAPPAEVRAWLEAQLEVDPHDERLHAPVRSRGKLAHGIELLLYRCPHCFAWDALVPHEDEVRCASCRTTWRVDTRNCLIGRSGPGASTRIVDARHAIRARNRESFVMDESRFRREGTIATSEVGELVDLERAITKPLGRGRLELDPRAVRVVDASQRLLLELPLDTIQAAVVEFRTQLNFRTKEGALYEFTMPRESALKWRELVEHWRKVEPEHRNLAAGA